MEPRPPCPSAQSAPRVRVAAMTTWKQASGNPFGPPDDDGYGGLGAAFGAVDPAPAPVDARFTHPAPALAPDARKPAAPSAVPDAFATAPSYDQMFGGAEASAPTPPEPAAVPQPAPVKPPPMSPAAPAPPRPPAPPPAPATPPAPAFAAATAFPFGAATVASEEAECVAVAPTGEDPPAHTNQLLSAQLLPPSPRSPRAAAFFVPARALSGSSEPGDETAPLATTTAGESFSHDAVSAREPRDGRDGPPSPVSAETSSPFLRRRDFARDEEALDVPDAFSFSRAKDDENASVEALASAAATAASSARRLEARVQELDAELEAYRLGADDAARALAENKATVAALRAALAAREGGAEKTTTPVDVDAEKHAKARLEDRLEKATRALDRERAASAKAAAAAKAAARRAAEAESRLFSLNESRESAYRAETESATARAKAAEAESACARLVAEANRVAAEATERARLAERALTLREATAEAAARASENERSPEKDAAAARAVRLELRVAPDADALSARESAAARLREEAEAISSASARVVEKLVRENGALVERIETLQTRASFRMNGEEDETPKTFREKVASEARRGDARVSSEKLGGDETAPPERDYASREEEDEEHQKRERPRGLWAFITGADRAPAKYVPRRAAPRAATGG